MRRTCDIRVDGVEMCAAHNAAITSLDIIEPDEKLHTVDVGGDGVLDLTEAIYGEVKYSQRVVKVGLAFVGANYRRDMDGMRRALKGRKADFVLTNEPECTYVNGRFSFKTVEGDSTRRLINLEITCDPYRRKAAKAYRVNAAGGVVLRLESGMRSVAPVFESERVLTVRKDGCEAVLPPGRHRAFDIRLQSGWNELFLSTRDVRTLKWSDAEASTWAQAAPSRWFEFQRGNGGAVNGTTWSEMQGTTWAAAKASTWLGLAYSGGESHDCEVTVSYDWSDL